MPAHWGIHTLPEARRRGGARACVLAWAAAEGPEPLSANWTNAASPALARAHGYRAVAVAAQVGAAAPGPAGEPAGGASRRGQARAAPRPSRATARVKGKGSVRTRTVGLLLFPGFEPLDGFGPLEAFVVARFPGRGGDDGPPHPFRVVTIAQDAHAVAMTGGPRVLPDGPWTACPDLDVLVVPGGAGTRREYRNAALLEFLRLQAPRVEVLASVCTGAALLAAAGLLDGLPATTNRRSFDWVAGVGPAVRWDRRARFVDAGRIVTAAGVSAGIDMALHVVLRLVGPEAAEAAARRMEHRWMRDPHDAAP